MRITSVLAFSAWLLLSCTRQSSNESQSDTLKSGLIDTIGTAKNTEAPQVTQQCGFENEMSDLGIGLIIAPPSFEIFNDSLLTDKFAAINMYEDQDLRICPLFYMPEDYGIMHFVCVSESESSYKVLINENEFRYLPKPKSYTFHTWDEYILQSFGIRRKTSLPVYHEPKENSKSVTIPDGREMFCPMEVKGDWVKVQYDCFYNLEGNPHEGEPCYSFIDECDKPITGWLKWRESNKLLIEIFLMP